MNVTKFLQMPLAILLTLSVSTPSFAWPDPAERADEARPAGGAIVGREVAPAGDAIPRGRPAPAAVGAIAAVNAARTEAGKEPLTPAQERVATNAIASASRTGQPMNAAKAAAIAESVTTINEARGPENQLTPGQTAQVVNAVMWGAQFVRPAAGGPAGGLGFTVTHNGTEARVVLADGARTNNMRVVVPGQQSGPVNLTSHGEGQVQFAMTTAVIGRGTAQFTQATVIRGLETGGDGNRAGFQNAGNIGGHVANAAGFPPAGRINQGEGAGQIALGANVPDIPAGAEVRITGAAIQNQAPGMGGVALNYSFTPAASVGSGGTGVPPAGPGGVPPAPGGAASINTTPDAAHVAVNPVVPGGHTADNLHTGAGAPVPGSVVMPTQQTVAGTNGEVWRSAPSIPQVNVNAALPAVNTIANHNGEAVAAGTEQGQVVVTPVAGNQSLVVIQTPPTFNNQIRNISAGAGMDVPLRISGTNAANEPVTINVSATANRESNGNGGREMGGRNGTLAFTLPAGFRAQTILPVGTNARLDLNDDMTRLRPR